MASEEEVKHLASEKRQVQAELANEKASKAVQQQNISKELCVEVSVPQREVSTAQEFVEEKELELEKGWLKIVSHHKVQRYLLKSVSKWQGTSEALKKEMGVLTKLGKELQSGQEKAFQKEQLLWIHQQEMAGVEAWIGVLMPIELLYQLWQVEQASLENHNKKGSMHSNENFVSRQETGPTSGGV